LALTLALERLRDYLHGFHSERAQPLPIEFWDIADDALFMEALTHLPLFLADLFDQDADALPEGFRLAFPIFWIDEDSEFNGGRAYANAGERLLPRAVEAYRRIGLHDEARGLHAALQAYRHAPRKTFAIEAAYLAVPKQFADAPAKRVALKAFFRGHPELWSQAPAHGKVND
jgi:hypothetical protein